MTATLATQPRIQQPTPPPARTPVLAVEDLVVSYESGRRRTQVVHGVSFAVGAGEVVALVGESGSGKTTTAQAVIGLLAENGRVEGGRVLLGADDLSGLNDKALRGIRGRRIGLVPQDPNNSLNPLKRIGDSLSEALRIHGWGSRQAIDARVLELLERVGIDDPARRATQYPHELSGGMKQRVLIAAAIALEPELIIADEPTSALDVTVQRRVLDLIDDLRRETGASVLLVTHDLGVARERADRIVVMRDGRLVEQGRTADVTAQPRDGYTRTLIAEAAVFSGGAPRRTDPARLASAPAIEVSGLVQEFGGGRGRTPFRAVDGVSLSVAAGTTHAIVGESGSGKTTTARAVLGFHRATAGSIEVAGVDVAALRTGRAIRDFRGRAQLVLQNPYSSLDPRQRVSDIIAEPLRNRGVADRATRAARVAEYLDRVALPATLADRLPRELSGGQRQRVAIARALILEPEVVVLDEPVSALDVTVQAQILRLLAELQEQLSLTYLFISHDLGVVAHLSDTVSVMRRGRVVEQGLTHDVFTDPQSAYTAELLAAIPGR
ncbi:ABC transporter ATP-binding protein [Propioniciclava coleopterorum]|uniref:ABC transporter ATP-binding protein n=1 Tax=Propioniciclava coleopterorum TaxID=2714937 RepID=A0A6G7YAI6_9ACTN|nr:ABC transporter ATP-binding protein [Propioniciclava coleopterorum]QIK73696.1 ABC transporter ATP-binding protein [Propioniciclava coleopterorum]